MLILLIGYYRVTRQCLIDLVKVSAGFPRCCHLANLDQTVHNVNVIVSAEAIRLLRGDIANLIRGYRCTSCAVGLSF